MSERIEVLTDLESGIWLDKFKLDDSTGPKLDGSPHWSIDKRTLRGGPSHDVDVVTVNNGTLSFDVLPTRGMGLWRGDYQGLQLGWRSPVRFPVHPSLVDVTTRNGLGWLAGFNEWMCRCGLSSLGGPGIDTIDNADGTRVEEPVTLHGRIANTPAHFVSVEAQNDGAGRLMVRGTVDEAMLFGPKLRLHATVETDAGSNWLKITDEITNFGDEASELQIMYHTNLGEPLLEAGGQVVAAARQIAPYDEGSASAIEQWMSYAGPTPGFTQQCYFLEPIADEQGVAQALLHNAAGDKGVSIKFNIQELPCFTLWKNTAGASDGYVTGLEPGTSYPNLKTFERQQGRVVVLAPGESYRASIQIEVHDSAVEVQALADRIHGIQDGGGPELHAKLHPSFSPDAS